MESKINEENILFPNYTQIPSKVPLKVWQLLRLLSVITAFMLVLTLYINPDTGLFIFWKVAVPLLPLVFLIMPGLWRNLCPLAAMNQFPRIFGFTKGLVHTDRIKEYSFVIGMSLFFILASSRKIIFNESGLATSLLILSALIFAFFGGVIFKGKSGWCSSICPLLPVQRLYGQTPFVTVPNSHCQPCVGCTKNCYDFNPSVAYLADQYDNDKNYSGYRRFFAAAFPGFILAYFLVPNPPVISVSSMYFQMATYMITGIGIFFFLDSFAKVSVNKLTLLCAVTAFGIYYWFTLPVLADSFQKITDVTIPDEATWFLRYSVMALSLIWLIRSFITEKNFILHTISSGVSSEIKLGAGAAASFEKLSLSKKDNAEVLFVPEDKRIAADLGRSVLEVTESCGLSIESGCRMGVCGADPVAIIEGMENLSSIGSDEKSTLARLGFAENTRMACSARINGNVKISLTPEKRLTTSVTSNIEFDESIKSIIIIGNGISGVTTADYIRRRHPKCEIHLIGREKNHLYNRMGISRLIYGRSAMQGLYLLPEAWYDEHNISCWLNTHVNSIDVNSKKVELATGENLEYDKLILATGSSSFVPPIPGYNCGGTFSLREADDAMNIRDYVQRMKCKNAIIAGGGLLGLEAAYALYKLGLNVTVLERGNWPLQRQLDERGGTILKDYLKGLGLEILTETEVAQINSDENKNVSEVILKDGRELPCEIFLVCAGVKPNIELAKNAGVNTNRGIIVDEEMRTNVTDVYATGDAAEFKEQAFGLWPVAVEQAEIAATNATGGKKIYNGFIPTTMLKVIGAEVTSIGKFDAATDDIVIIPEETETGKYRKLVISNDKITGAILIGYPVEGPMVTKAVKEEINIISVLDSLKMGNLNELNKVIKN